MKNVPDVACQKYPCMIMEESKETYTKNESVCNQETKKVKVSILNTNPFHNIINRVEQLPAVLHSVM